MPNKRGLNKRRGSRIAASGRLRKPTGADSVKDLLARMTPTLTRVTHQATRQTFWRGWLEAHLPPEIAGKLSGVVEREGTLVLFAESSAWSARLRYAAQEIEAQIRAAHPGITEVTVRVLPR
jgi:predicted nucleic acid-binding Zn ribbon protein